MAAEMTGGALRPVPLGQDGLARVDLPVSLRVELLAAPLDLVSGAVPRQRFKEDSVWHVRVTVVIARHAHQFFHPVVIRREFFVLDRPGREIERTVAPAQSGPEQRLAADGLRHEIVEAGIALFGERLFRGIDSEMAARVPSYAVFRRLVWHGMAVEILRGIDPFAGF